MAENFDLDTESQISEKEAMEMQSNLLDESDGDETEQSQTTRLNDPCLASDVADNRARLHHLGSDAVDNRAGLHHLGSDAVRSRTGQQINSKSIKKRLIIGVILAIIVIASITILIVVLTKNPDSTKEDGNMHGGTDKERCTVNDIIQKYKESQVWTKTSVGLYQSFNESTVEHGISVYMNCTDGYVLKNNDGETLSMASGTCINGTVILTFTCQPKRCNVKDVIPYQLSQVWTMTKDGLYQSLTDSMVVNGTLVYMNCTDGYDLKNNKGDTINMASGTCIKGALSLPFTCQPKRCTVNDVILYKESQVWTSTGHGLYQSIKDSNVKHGILVYMNCTSGYDLKNNDGETINMANGTCNEGKLSLPFTCQPICLHGGEYLKDKVCECSLPYYGSKCEKVYIDCYDIHQQTAKPTGIYEIKPRGFNETIKVQCDMGIDAGGWTVLQSRCDGSVDFYRNFSAYENGFGSLTGEFWLGLRYIHAMTSSTPSLLRVDLEAADGTKAYQQFDNFTLSEGPDYRLHIGTSSGTAGDSRYYGLSYTKGQKFSTYDRDVDRWGGGNCAVDYHGAWWYRGCTHVNLNGEYAPPGTRITITSGYDGMYYRDFKKRESLKTSKIMFRRK